MLLLLLFAFIVLFIYFGYYIMAKLDKFLEEKKLVTDYNKACTAAILFGESQLANQVALILEKNHINVQHVTEPFLINSKRNFKFLFALSENDADNIILCKIGRKVYDIEKIISICNDKRNLNMFIREKIFHITGKSLTAQMIYMSVLQEKEEANEKE